MTETPGLDVAGLAAWLADAHPELIDTRAPEPAAPHRPLTVGLIAGGRSNLTYRVDGARMPLIVRRPPLGHVLSSAHDMAREHRVISALWHTDIPVPPTIDFVDDTDENRVTGTPFFVMEAVDGRVLAYRRQNADLTRDGMRLIGLELAATLAELHRVDPAEVGLADFGRPEGYLTRQLSTWRRQYDASRSRELPELDRLQETLETTMPEEHLTRPAIVHGDYRLDNALVAGSGDSPHLAAVLDWEMATLGDPLVDLGILGLYWNIAAVPGAGAVTPSAVDEDAGYPSFDELVEHYAERAGIAVPDISWHRAFAAYKLAVIAEGIHYRWQAGETVGEGFDRIGGLVPPLAAEGLALTSTRRK